MRALVFLLVFAPLLFLALACEAASPLEAPPADGMRLDGARIAGAEVASVTLRGDRIAAVGEGEEAGVAYDLTGRWLAPAFIDAHVHLAYYPAGDDLARGGVAGAVDWAAPLKSMGDRPIRVAWAGPIITAIEGYPTQGWGRNGYGLEVADASAGRAAVAQVQAAGASVVKVSVGAGGPDLSDEALAAIVAEAHTRGMLVGVHALSDSDARRAAGAGCDILVHAPVAALSKETVQAWAGKAVIPTISAFGGVDSTRQLREAGATVLYGTDFGNTRALGVSPREIEGMLDAGMTGAQILAAGTSVPAATFGMEDLGAIEVGKEASLLVLDADPLVDPGTLTRPVAVIFRGAVVAGTMPD